MFPSDEHFVGESKLDFARVAILLMHAGPLAQ